MIHENYHAEVYRMFGCNSTVDIMPEGVFGITGSTTPNCNNMTASMYGDLVIAQAEVEKGGEIGISIIFSLVVLSSIYMIYNLKKHNI